MLNLLARTTFLGGVIVLAAYHNANFKSTNSARQECVLYRDVQNLTLIGTRFRSDLESTCVCRCELIKIGLWTDALGHLEIPTMQFYNGDPNNLTFLENVRECVSEIPPNLDLCYRAFKYYKCYVSYFGDVNLDLPRFVPSTDLQQQQTVVDCARILQISHQDLRSIAATLCSSPPRANACCDASSSDRVSSATKRVRTGHGSLRSLPRSTTRGAFGTASGSATNGCRMKAGTGAASRHAS
ncbi:general odorant-binding protein 45-like [Culex quinquefasciatus]|uniref:general odorant-binding protein 45-like n=1 Tax=Culex quinquefasciatus TaxID=7176 RepID=UPI0018E2FFD2|nr:general odorant-binding protein 45-like [Culex quinquefasciatus]